MLLDSGKEKKKKMN